MRHVNLSYLKIVYHSLFYVIIAKSDEFTQKEKYPQTSRVFTGEKPTFHVICMHIKGNIEKEQYFYLSEQKKIFD